MEQTQALLGGRKHNIELGMVSLPHCLFSFFFSLFFLFSSSVVVVVDSQQPEQGCVREGGLGASRGCEPTPGPHQHLRRCISHLLPSPPFRHLIIICTRV